MEDSVKQECRAIERLVENWENSYFRIYKENLNVEKDEKGSWDFLAKDLAEEIGLYIVPYVSRLLNLAYLTEIEVKEFLTRIYMHVKSLLDRIRKVEAECYRQALVLWYPLPV